MRIFEHKVVGPLACNCYIVGDPGTKEALVIDPGGDADALAASIAQQALQIKAIVATHAHFDHIVAAGRLRELTGAPFYLHPADRPLLDWYQESALLFLGIELPPPPEVDASTDEGDELKVGDVEFAVLHTPGHSPGSITLAGDSAVFSGDTLFEGSVGRFDLPGGDEGTLTRSIQEKLFAFDDDTPVFPGHGAATTVGREKRYNPFVGLGARLWLPGR